MKRIFFYWPILILVSVLFLSQIDLQGGEKAQKPYAAIDVSSTWEQVGPDFCPVESLAYNPYNEAEIYLLTSGGLLYKTRNGGNSWYRVSRIHHSGDILRARHIEVDPVNPRILYALGGKGLFISQDGGFNWTFHGFGENYQSYTAQKDVISVYPKNSQIVYVAASTTDGGKTSACVLKWNSETTSWTYKQVPDSWPEYVAVHPNDSDIIYCNNWKSLDGGDTWKVLIKDNPPVYSLTIDPTNPNKIYAWSDHVLFKSIDGGINWIKSSIQYANRSVYPIMDPVDSNIIYIPRYYGLAVSHDGGDSWDEYNHGFSGINSLLPLPSGLIFLGSRLGLFKSTTSGITSLEVKTGIKAARLHYVAVAPTSPHMVYCSSPVYMSEDFGMTWENTDDSSWGQVIVDPQDEDVLHKIYQVHGHFFHRNYYDWSSDQGRSWKHVYWSWYEFFADIAIGKYSNSVYIIENGSIDTIILHRYKENSGWNYDVTGKQGSARITLDPYDDETVYLSGFHFTDWYEYEGYPYLSKSEDGGESWVDIDISSIEGNITEVKIDPHSSERIFLCTSQNMYKSEDYGKTWEKLLSLLERSSSSIVIDPLRLGELYIGGDWGVYASQDYGQTWQDFNKGLFFSEVTCLSLDAENGILYASTDGGGIFRRSIFPQMYKVTIRTTKGGSTLPYPGPHLYEDGERARFIAVPDEDCRFDYWSGDAAGSTNPLFMIIDGRKEIKAHFVSRVTLKLRSGNGGTTDPAPGNYKYDHGSWTEIKAVAKPGFTFSHWSGDASGKRNPKKIALNKDKTIKAHFIKTSEK